MTRDGKRHFKDGVFGQLERVGKALASRRRLELLDVLAQGEHTVETLAKETAMSVANVSQHLQVLHRSRLAETRQEGTYVYYRLADERVIRLLHALRDVGEARLAELHQIHLDYRNKRGGFEPVGMQELFERMRADNVIVLDVRPNDEYQAGHISGARSIPLDELEARLEELPPNSDIVAYCRGPYCVFADEAVEQLRRHGRPARRLDLGYPDWWAAGLPVSRPAGTSAHRTGNP